MISKDQCENLLIVTVNWNIGIGRDWHRLAGNGKNSIIPLVLSAGTKRATTPVPHYLEMIKQTPIYWYQQIDIPALLAPVDRYTGKIGTVQQLFFFY